ncbi:MAG: polysaccharide deacetylase family protein, partial [Candidatus Heimdallarchaeota archaeon]
TGPDRTGRNLFHIHQRKTLFLKTPQIRRYGLKQILYGLLLPAPLMETQKDIIKEIVRKGHEVGLHGYDHYRWANYFHIMSKEEIDSYIQKGIQILTRILGRRPVGFASPSFKWSPSSLLVQNRWGFIYSSDIRGNAAFYPHIGKITLKTLQIPISEPLIEELMLASISESKVIDFLRKKLKLKKLRTKTFVTIYIHAGYECIFKKNLLRAILIDVQRFEHVNTYKFEELAEKYAKSANVMKMS